MLTTESELMKSVAPALARFAATYYVWGARVCGRGAQLLRLRHLPLALSRFLPKPLSLVGFELLVAASLALYFFFLVCPQAEAPRDYDKNEFNLSLFTRFSSDPYLPER